MRKPKNTLLRALQRSTVANINPENQKITTRRDFLTTTTKAGLLVAASAYIPFLTSCQSKHNKPKIVILGAGIAGLTAAYNLKKAGLSNTDVQIYDSLKRVGGRIHTDATFIPGLTMEIGGEFIDTDHTEMLNLAKEFKLDLKDNKTDSLNKDTSAEWYCIAGKRYTEEEVIKEFNHYAPLIKSDREAAGEKWDTLHALKLDNMSVEEYFDRIKLSGWLRELLNVAYLSELGLPLAEQSAINFIGLINSDTKNGFKIFGDSDERFSIKGGNSKVIESLAENVSPVNLDHHLEAVKSKGDGFTLTFNGNKEVYADFVINTIPFKVLREVKMDIDMPAKKKKAIDELGYGNNAKLFLGFKERIWRTKYQNPGYSFNENIHNGWDNSWMQNNNEGPAGYTIYLGGREAVTLAENKKDKKKMAEKYLPMLDHVYPGLKEQWSGEAEIAWWPVSKAIKGSYSAYKVGQYSSISGHEIEPVGNMLFAGEHCSTDFQGFMNGGAETGKKAASDLIKLLNG